MDSEHRKIELQSPADLTYITAKIRTLARQKLDLHLPTQADATEPDELRTNVENLVDAFVTQVLLGMKANISINGIDVVSRGSNKTGGDAMDVDGDQGSAGALGNLEDGVVEVEEFEPFDDKLRARLGAAVQKRDALVAKISNHRRTTPALAARKFEEQFEHEMRAMEAAQEEADRYAAEIAGQDGEVVGAEGLKRQEEVERNWERALEGLERLNKGLPETRARLERCRDVVGYLGGKGKA
ncbi:hypothetical protein DM02DRAFT_617272 [Periconia macrospinosa]|uniref:Kinetochore protein mis14 n=1 Tax=Periconia macrospinosa TaxID=97972 RepID=A0A2V1DGW9_9PLEO|nr:hypothetical protein DM02DRAFT_617272 [Periconia macrospinosa]